MRIKTLISPINPGANASPLQLKLDFCKRSIKQLKPIANNPNVYQLVQERFEREAAIFEELGEGSTQIPRLYAYFAEHGQFYLVQEWIKGVT